MRACALLSSGPLGLGAFDAAAFEASGPIRAYVCAFSVMFAAGRRLDMEPPPSTVSIGQNRFAGE
jgi:hypothetical protein